VARGKAPRHETWLVCLVLYLIAILAHFGVLNVGYAIPTWSWIVGYALLLIAVQVKGL
jgi:uncharacterized membrane protein YhaH (DUF805 family)